MELGKKIKQLRYKSGLTQEQLAERLGIGAQSVSKWENAVSMPDISVLPLLAEVFGVTIDDLFDLTVEQRFNRIENRMDAEDNLPQDVYLEYEEFLKSQLPDEQNKKRATELIAYLYWHRMEGFAKKASRYAREAVQLSPAEKGCQWILMKADGHAAWDWNMHNHTKAVDFYRDLVEKHPDTYSPYLYLIDNLLADHRTDEAEYYLTRLRTLEGPNPMLLEAYRAHIALARFDEKTADQIIEELLTAHPDDSAALFESAQYFAGKCEYDRAIECYERSFAKTTRHPRFMDELMGIADIYQIQGKYRQAAQTYDRIIELLQTEWGMSDEDDVKKAQAKKAELLKKADKP